MLDPLLVELVGSLAGRTGPMTTLRTAVSAAAALDPDDEDSPEANLRKAYRLMAKTPQLIATYQRLRTGADAIDPRDDLGIAANFLYALTGKEPDAQVARDFDVVLVLYADHTLNASTFAGRVAAATLPTCTRPPPPPSPPSRAPARRAIEGSARCWRRSAPRPGPTGSGTAGRQAEDHGLRPRVYKTGTPGHGLNDIAERLGRQLRVGSLEGGAFVTPAGSTSQSGARRTVMEAGEALPQRRLRPPDLGYSALGLPNDPKPPWRRLQQARPGRPHPRAVRPTTASSAPTPEYVDRRPVPGSPSSHGGSMSIITSGPREGSKRNAPGVKTTRLSSKHQARSGGGVAEAGVQAGSGSGSRRWDRGGSC